MILSGLLIFSVAFELIVYCLLHCLNLAAHTKIMVVLQNRPRSGDMNDILLPNGRTLVLRGPPRPVLGSPCPPPGKDVSQCRE